MQVVSAIAHLPTCSNTACGKVVVSRFNPALWLGHLLQPDVCRLKSITAQHELHDQLKVMRCEKYVAEALHAADLEAEEQVSSPAPWAVVFTSSVQTACDHMLLSFKSSSVKMCACVQMSPHSLTVKCCAGLGRETGGSSKGAAAAGTAEQAAVGAVPCSSGCSKN